VSNTSFCLFPFQYLKLFNFKFLTSLNKMVQMERRVIPAPCRLVNTKNNCFFNSVMQCTMYIYPVVTYFESGEFTKEQRICRRFQGFIKKYIESKVMDPQFFINGLASDIHILDGNEQDAQEFLLLFYGKLTEELGLLDNVSIANVNQLRKIGRTNVMVKTFFGLVLNRLRCMSCFAVTEHTHQFRNLTLDVTESVQESVNKYLKDEVYNSEILCESCEKMAKVSVARQITAFPEVLILQLSRFINVDRKNDSYVVVSDKLQMDKKTYHLIGMVCHSGTLRNGHYVAYAKTDLSWHCFDDMNVSELKDSHISNTGAYILFYSRI
ncbi:ubiquitin thiolesterase, partial [Trachipleistophora hominis]